MDVVGFVGIGNMGRPMVARLRDAGHNPLLFDAAPENLEGLSADGARILASSVELGASADIAFISLPSPEIVREVALQLADGGRVRLIVDLSTTGPSMAALVAKDLAVKGVSLLDCPVSGGVAGARNGKLALMVGGSEDDLARARPLLETFGRIFHVGLAPGMGQMMKVINNLMSASALSASSEGVTMAVKAGLDPEMVVEVLNAGSGRSSATLDKFPRQILTGSFDAGFSIGLMLKDVRLCLAEAKALGLSLPACEAVAEIWESAAREIGADEDFTRIVQIAEEAAGIVVRGRGRSSGAT
jgi:3-hydroxyisobutyrate dehydrogenase-like beta-hydroxyacid dehydrogenase